MSLDNAQVVEVVVVEDRDVVMVVENRDVVVVVVVLEDVYVVVVRITSVQEAPFKHAAEPLSAPLESPFTTNVPGNALPSTQSVHSMFEYEPPPSDETAAVPTQTSDEGLVTTVES
eukprot:CAMPEP_0115546490 /NCGR_PEP_ID=MMETSP0271-20121206/93158_1 /TAXON_ID=71861 /ORGANISM="Scrippsiella trochoidea, Strain CCMP3099" /LENGTH=115 /DNA_ID=CAMNT_0002979893 /DNA_START=87 /DNA_END=430 /DNA_ORIENTATION=-